MSGFSSSQMATIQQNMIQSSTETWEIGVALEALLEYLYPQYTVFSSGFTDDMVASTSTSAVPEVYSIVQPIVASIPSGSLQIMQDEASGDPASIGPAVLLLSIMQDTNTQRYQTAASNQLRALLQNTPRSSTGAISQRTNEVSLWADFVNMAPPFIAYDGLIRSNNTLIQIAYDQCRLYRQALRDNSTGLFMHIAPGSSFNDDGLWATGNAWAANGMLRVAEIIARLPSNSSFAAQSSDLIAWTADLLTVTWNRQNAQNLIPNYMQEGASSAISFGDPAATALMASISYRFAELGYGSTTIGNAERARVAVQNSLGSNGFLQGTVDPIQWDTQSNTSPEGLAFAMLMQARYQAWANSTGNGGNGGSGGNGGGRSSGAGRLAICWFLPILSLFLGLSRM